MTEPAPATWTVVVPVKGATGKSRLGHPARAELAGAIALDTVTAATRAALVAEVVVVTGDAVVAAEIVGIPLVRGVPDPGRGLNAAIAHGLSLSDGDRAVLLGDLPALRPHDLDAALSLAAAARRPGAVADAEGTGTTLVAAPSGIRFTPAFGAGSFARHLVQGCAALAVPDASTLRRDVDTADQLAAAATLGLGPRTAALMASRA